MANKPKSRQQKGGNHGSKGKQHQATGSEEDAAVYDEKYIEYEINLDDLEECDKEDTASFDPVQEGNPQKATGSSQGARVAGSPRGARVAGTQGARVVGNAQGSRVAKEATPNPKEQTGQKEQWDYNENWEEESASAPKRNDVVLCGFCGEEYSVTYKRCPFCDERHLGSGSGRASGGSMDPRHIVGFSISMVLICTAGFIVVKQVLPLLGPQSSSSSTVDKDSVTTTKPASTPDIDTDVNVDDYDFSEDSTLDPNANVDVEGNVTVGDEATETPEVEVPTQPEPALDFDETTETPSNTVTLSATDVTLGGGEAFTLSVTSGGSATFESSHPDYASVSANGVVTNHNTTGDTLLVTITATVNGVRSSCVVRCQSGAPSVPSVPSVPEASTTTPDTSATTPSTSTGTASPSIGTGKGSITTTVNIRSGPGTTYEAIATGYEGSEITVVAASTEGWYEITFTGSNGVREKGYLKGDFISMG